MATVEQGQEQQPKKVTGGAFGRFLAEQRAALTEECKGKPATAVVKLASERFKALGEAERKLYDDKYRGAVKQYEKDMEAFLAAGGEKKATKRNAAETEKGKKAKDPEAPKKPVGGAYGIFQNEKREEFTKAVEAKGEKGFGPVAKMTSEAFKTLNEAEKAVYEQKYAQKVSAYAEALKAYKEKKAMEAPAEKPASPAKRGRPPAGPKSSSASAAKRGRKSGGDVPPAPDFDADVVAAADKEGLMTSLGNLARRPEILAKGLEPMEMLIALKKNGGLVNKTKAELLGGA